jgi:hypothetical protein
MGIKYLIYTLYKYSVQNITKKNKYVIKKKLNMCLYGEKFGSLGLYFKSNYTLKG